MVAEDKTTDMFIQNTSFNPFFIGRMDNVGQFNVTMDEVQIYNTSLTQAEVTTLFNAQGSSNNVTTVNVGNGRFNLTLTANGTEESTETVGSLNSFINNYLSNCTLISSTCRVPFVFSSESTGTINYTNLNFSNEGFTENSITFNEVAGTGTSQSFTINITYDSSYWSSISASFTYNNTAQSTSKIGSGNNILYNTTLTTPATLTNLNKTFFWSFTFTNGSGSSQSFNSTSNTQNITPLSIDDCSTNGHRILNLSLFDEDARTTFINGTIEVIAELFTVGTTDLIGSFNNSYDYSPTPGAGVCLSNINQSSDLYYQVKYNANVTYATEYKFAQAITINNETGTQQVDLYNLLDHRSTPFDIILRGSDLTIIQGAIIDIQRQYVPINQFISVESPRTDFDGSVIANLVLRNELYNFIVTKNGTTLGTFNGYNVECQNDATGDCRIELNLIASTNNPTDFSSIGNLSYNYLWNPTTRSLSLNFLTTDGLEHSISWNVTRLDNFGNETICTNTASATSGTFLCSVPASLGNTTILAQLYSDGRYLGANSFSFGDTPSDIFGGTRVILGVLMYSTLIMLMAFNQVGMIIGAFLGMGFAAGFRIIDGGSFLGNSFILAWFFIAGIIIIVYMNKITKRGGAI
jgi:hypothetical protein